MQAITNFMRRRDAEPVQTEETDDHPLSSSGGDIEDNNSLTEEDGEEGEFVGSGGTTTNNNNNRSGQATPILEAVPDDEDSSNSGDEEAPNAASPSGRSRSGGDETTTRPRRSNRSSSSRRPRITLRDLEEEREIVRRRTSACVLLSAFLLLRLWIQAVVSGDFGLLLLCLVFTSWTARFIRHCREREEELDRLISEYDENQNEDENNTMNDARLRRMSFQSQLALAIMQSQMQMMQGGYGHPDGGDRRPGVTDDAKSHWDRFTYSAAAPKKKGDYGSVSATDDDSLGKGDHTDSSEEEPHCSICLCEYENGENLISLPCKHIFHDDCISSWTSNNTRCPLCNYDLESAGSSGDEAV